MVRRLAASSTSRWGATAIGRLSRAPVDTASSSSASLPRSTPWDERSPGSMICSRPGSLGTPTVTVGRGGRTESQHSPGEWFDPTNAYLGPHRNFLAVLALVGVDGVAKPMLPKRPPRQ